MCAANKTKHSQTSKKTLLLILDELVDDQTLDDAAG